MRYVLWVVALMEACDVTKHGRHLDHHLGFYQELKKMVKTARIEVEILRLILCVLCFT